MRWETNINAQAKAGQPGSNPWRVENMKQNFISIPFTLCVLLAVGLACSGGGSGGGSDDKPAGPEYVGAWSAADGSTITIRSDASADYKSGGTSVSGGSATVNEKDKTLSITFFGIGPTMKIDKAPAGNRMTLDGIVYSKDGGGTTSSSDSKLEVPSKEKLQALVRATIHDLNDAIQSGDFGDFHKKTGKPWRETTSPEELKEAFKTFVENKERFELKRAISAFDATFSPEPSIGKVAGIDALLVKGIYPTSPKQLHFDLKYAMDDGTWKLVSVDVQTKGN